jgi:hypothetical protein
VVDTRKHDIVIYNAYIFSPFILRVVSICRLSSVVCHLSFVVYSRNV